MITLGTAWLVWQFTDLDRYYGFSGALHGLFAYGCLLAWYDGDRWAWTYLLGLIGKLVYESTAGASEQTELAIDAKVAVEAHQLGTLAGLIWAIIWIVKQLKTNKARH